MTGRTCISVVLCASAVLLVTPPALGAGGCSRDKCMPRTGKWTAPSPQKLTSPFGPTKLSFKVTYMRNGKRVDSRYGNTIPSFGVYLRYFCDDPNSPWVETGASAPDPIRIDGDGKVKTKFTSLGGREHRLTMTFRREKFSGRISGSATNSEGQVCTTSVSFSGKRR